MARSRFTAVICVVVAALAIVAATDDAPSPQVARAEKLLFAMRDGRYAEVVKEFDETMATLMPADKLKAAWAELLGSAGAFASLDERREAKQGDLVIVDLLGTFEKGPLVVRLVFRRDGKVSGLWFLPLDKALPRPGAAARAAPEYVKADAFKEEEITIGKAPWQVPGTLALPEGKGPFPALLLLAGSGPNDRDETIGGSKPFRDIGLGLASRGIVTLRYDKRTYAHGHEMAKDLSRITVRQEVLDDAALALEALRARSEVDGRRVLVLGHSLGGTLAPLVADADGKLAGLVLLAAGARPIADAMAEQLDYIATLARNDEEKADVERARAQVETLRTGKLDADTAVLGLTRRYLDDLARRDPLRVARKLSLPVLLLQGGRDYQSTEKDLALWKQALGARPTVTAKLYPDLNHLFAEGKGKATPDEYAKPHQVAAAVIDDIAAFILARP